MGRDCRRYGHFPRFHPCIVVGSPLSRRASGRSRSPAALRVVWAEDSDSDQFLIKAALAGTPFESGIQFAFDGQQALEEIAKDRPVGVVLDVNMPNMDGITALRRIRLDHGDLPVIMFSTANDAEQVRECRKLGVLAYAVKPIDYDAFCVVVARILAHFKGEPVTQAEPFIVRAQPTRS